MSEEDMIPNEPAMLTLTSSGYVKRTNPTEYKKQNRGGVGVVDLNTKEEDFVTRFLEASTHDHILFFTDKGKVYQTRMFDVPEGKRATKGKSIMNVLPLSTEERVTSIVAMPKDMNLPAGRQVHVGVHAGNCERGCEESKSGAIYRRSEKRNYCNESPEGRQPD
jgi:DNA gyrase/topoisomerase IV subunit A